MSFFKKNLDKRKNILLPYIKGKKILDLGPGDISDRFLHKFLSENAESVIGLELDEKRAESLIKKGYNIRKGNAQDFDLEEKFDVIVAGDLIEHLTNFEGFFNSIKKHMHDKTILILNTPNAFSFYTLTGIQRKPFHEHTCWFCEDTLKQLLSHFNLKVRNKYYYTNDYGTFKSKIIQFITKIKIKWNSDILLIIKK